jgi:hypothetical protein
MADGVLAMTSAKEGLHGRPHRQPQPPRAGDDDAAADRRGDLDDGISVGDEAADLDEEDLGDDELDAIEELEREVIDGDGDEDDRCGKVSVEKRGRWVMAALGD